MEFNVNLKELKSALALVGRGVSTRSTLPILGNVLIEAGGPEIRLAATDLEVGIETRLPAAVTDPGSCAVPARLLAEIAGNLDGDDVTLTARDHNTIELTARGSKYDLLGLPPEEFPPLPEVGQDGSFEIAAEQLALVLRCCLPAISDDNTRPILTGVSLALEPGIVRFAATDTHRLAVVTAPRIEAGMEATPILVPGDTLEKVEMALRDFSEETVAVRFDANQCAITLGPTRITTRLLEGTFPKWERIVPREHTTSLVCETASLHEAARRVLVVAREGGNGIDFAWEDGRLVLSATAGTVGQAREEVEAILEGEPVEFRLNAKYLLDFTKTAGEGEFRMFLTEPLAPLRIEMEAALSGVFVIMPMQIV